LATLRAKAATSSVASQELESLRDELAQATLTMEHRRTRMMNWRAVVAEVEGKQLPLIRQTPGLSGEQADAANRLKGYEEEYRKAVAVFEAAQQKVGALEAKIEAYQQVQVSDDLKARIVALEKELKQAKANFDNAQKALDTVSSPSLQNQHGYQEISQADVDGILSASFIADKGLNTSFVCERCGAQVPALQGGFRDHCPQCLWSKHLDNAPGDRANKCKGSLEPIGLMHNGRKGWMIFYRCTECGAIKKNKAAADDNSQVLIELSAEPLFISSPATITVSAYTNPLAWQEATEALLGPMVAEHGERIFDVTDLLNEHAQAPDMVSLDGTPGLEQIVRANPSEESRAAYRRSVNLGQWARLIPAGGDATRLGLGIAKVLLDFKELLGPASEESLERAFQKALAKKEITDAQIQEIRALRSQRPNLRNVSILGRILMQDARHLPEGTHSFQTFIFCCSEGDEESIARELHANAYYGL